MSTEFAGSEVIALEMLLEVHFWARSTFDFTIFVLTGAKSAVKFLVSTFYYQDSILDLLRSTILSGVCSFTPSSTVTTVLPREV